jgi:hypothetical protein
MKRACDDAGRGPAHPHAPALRTLQDAARRFDWADQRDAPGTKSRSFDLDRGGRGQ